MRSTIFFRDDTACSLVQLFVRETKIGQPSPADIEKSWTLAFFSLGTRRRRIVFMKWCRLLLDLTRLERNPSRQSRWLRRGLIRLTALFDSLLLRVHVFVRACWCVCVCVCVCVCTCVHIHQSVGPIGPLGATELQCDWYCAP